MNYEEAREHLGKDRSKKITETTYIEARGMGGVALRYHNTDLLTFYSDGTVLLDSNRYKTKASKRKFNEFLPEPYQVTQSKNIWWLSPNTGFEGKTVVFTDNMIVQEDRFEVLTKPHTEKGRKALHKQIQTYSKRFIGALLAGDVPGPTGGDCWACCMKTKEGIPMGALSGDPEEHFRKHMKENYFVPTMFTNALELAEEIKPGIYAGGGKDNLTRATLSVLWGNVDPEKKDNLMRFYCGDSTKDRMTRILRKYLYKQFSLPY